MKFSQIDKIEKNVRVVCEARSVADEDFRDWRHEDWQEGLSYLASRL